MISGGKMVKVTVSDYEQLSGDTISQIKKVGDGSIITRFDRTPIPKNGTDVICPHFLELKWATGCPYNCAWCYLQGTFRFQEYKKTPRLKDEEKIKVAVDSLLSDDQNKTPEILNAGELSDSFMTEGTENPFSKWILKLLKGQDRYKVLFVTKSDKVDDILSVSNTENCIVSFSVNAPVVSKKWEHGAVDPISRLNAAKKLSDAGFTVRLRLDPMVPIDGWKKEYDSFVDAIFDRFTPDRITTGSLRGLQSTINNSPDRTWTPYLNERSNWGRKVDYETRLEMYRALIDKLNEKGFKEFALCKETVDCWNALGLDYKKIRCNCTL